MQTSCTGALLYCILCLNCFEVFVNFVYGDLYSSIDGLELLIDSEKDYLEALENYINHETERLDIIEREQERRKQLFTQHSDGSFWNLINEFLFLKTISDNNFFGRTQVLPGVDNFNQYCADTKEIFIGQDEDMAGAAVALLRVEDTYKIYPAQISDPMTSDDCFYMGHIAITEGRFDQAVLWLLEVEKKLETEPEGGVETDTRQFNHTVLYDYMAYALREQENYEWALWYIRKIQNMSIEYPCEVHIDYFEQMLRRQNSTWDGKEEHLPPINIDRTGDEFPEYEALCRGENQNTSLVGQNVLYCYYKRNSPFLKLAPIKIELLHRKPDIFWFPEALSDVEVNGLLAAASPNLDRSLVVNPNWKENNEEYQMKSKYRTSKLTAINDEELKLGEIVTKRVSDMTDLSVEPESTEMLQVANYGIGGHYSPHYDMATSEEDMSSRHHMFGESGNRIGTMLFYLSDPKGGATVFDNIDVTVFAKKNGAVFWYNLLKNGDPDLLTHHGGCPVLSGQKWIANKWLHEIGQEFRRPCSLNPNE